MTDLSDTIESYRDRLWRRDPELRVETEAEATRLIEQLGFCAALTDARTPLPSLYIAVCGRREAFTPRNVQKDPETSLAWTIKDDIVRRGRVFYAKLGKARALFVAPNLISAFNAVFGVVKDDENARLSANARRILAVLRREWEMATSDLRTEAKIADRKELTKALDELQAKMLVVPGEVLYKPKFTYIWTLAAARFPDQLSEQITRETALCKIAGAFLRFSGEVRGGEIEKTMGLTRVEANFALLSLVEENFAERTETGTYRLQGVI